MNPTLKATLALTLALLFAVPASGRTLARPVDVPARTLVEQGQGLTTNPPAKVRQPGARTRLVVAIVAGTLIGIGILVFARRR